MSDQGRYGWGDTYKCNCSRATESPAFPLALTVKNGKASSWKQVTGVTIPFKSISAWSWLSKVCTYLHTLQARATNGLGSFQGCQWLSPSALFFIQNCSLSLVPSTRPLVYGLLNSSTSRSRLCDSRDECRSVCEGRREKDLHGVLSRPSSQPMTSGVEFAAGCCKWRSWTFPLARSTASQLWVSMTLGTFEWRSYPVREQSIRKRLHAVRPSWFLRPSGSFWVWEWSLLGGNMDISAPIPIEVC